MEGALEGEKHGKTFPGVCRNDVSAELALLFNIVWHDEYEVMMVDHFDRVICNTVNYGILLSIMHMGGSPYVNVVISGFLEIVATMSGLFLMRKMALSRILFVGVFMGGLMCLTGGLIPGGFGKSVVHIGDINVELNQENSHILMLTL